MAQQHTTETIQAWANNYRVVTHKTASQDILRHIVMNLDNHSFSYGPTDKGGYTLTVSGPYVNNVYVLKADEE